MLVQTFGILPCSQSATHPWTIRPIPGVLDEDELHHQGRQLPPAEPIGANYLAVLKGPSEIGILSSPKSRVPVWTPFSAPPRIPIISGNELSLRQVLVYGILGNLGSSTKSGQGQPLAGLLNL